MRRAVTLLAVVLTMVGVMAVPAAADGEFTFTDSVTFQDVDPCTGELTTITINVLVQVHEHPDDVFIRVRRTGYTDTGYVMAHGWQRISITDGVFQAQFEDPWNNPGTGEKFGAASRFLEVDGQVIVDDFVLICLS